MAGNEKVEKSADQDIFILVGMTSKAYQNTILRGRLGMSTHDTHD